MLELNLILGFISILSCSRVECTLNMFLDKTEIQNLLGLKHELYYVQEGKIMQQNMNNTIIVSMDIDVIHFTWQSVNSSHLVPYTCSVKVSREEMLHSINMNISEVGTVPAFRETVAINISCSGIEDAEVTIYFSFNFTLMPDSDVVSQVTFNRKKLCHYDSKKVPDEINEYSLSAESNDSSQLTVFYIVLCLGCSFITVLVICFLAFIVTNKKDNRRNRSPNEQEIRLRATESENAPYVVGGLGVNSGTSTSSNISHNSLRRNKNYYTQLDNRMSDLFDRISEITVERKRIRLLKMELEGTFGRVFNGMYSKEDGSEENVIVKTVRDFACSSQISLLLREGMAMYGLKHRNIMTVFGVSIEDHTEPFVVYLREGYTNLKKFLQKCKVCPEGIARTLTTQEVVEIALQIIAGIMYMHKKKLLHKDIATRNCLVDSQLNVKVADNALSRDLFPNDYHCLGDNENRPVKWLAIESLVYKTFSAASDVWSFGVTLWELTTLAQQPYVEIDPFEIEHYLKDGYRLSQPVNCPDELFAVMAYCWAMSPDERPTFPQLFACLQDFHNQLHRYV